ncbi:MAG: AAA family ATPase [Clostridia bacterium]
MSKNMTVDELDSGHPLIARVLDNIDQVIVGKRAVAERLLCALIAGGHVLLEDVPGVGKTMLAKTLAASVHLSFSRIQFTPDLLPSDILGVSIYDPGERQFRFRSGPVFANLVLADEVNRTSPRTQSALLEVMEEKQVTVDGQTYPMEEPFCVVATENPIEYEGTFPLPEAQLDRFLFRLRMGYPDTEEEYQLLKAQRHTDPFTAVTPVMDQAQLLQLRRESRQVDVQEPVLRYLTHIVERTRDHQRIYLGVSPRASLALLHASQAWALMRGRRYVVPDDVRRLAPDVFTHRIIPRGGSRRDSHQVVQDVVSDILQKAPAPTGDFRG